MEIINRGRTLDNICIFKIEFANFEDSDDLICEITKWCEYNHIKYTMGLFHIWIFTEEAAMAFKLRWM